RAVGHRERDTVLQKLHTGEISADGEAESTGVGVVAPVLGDDAGDSLECFIEPRLATRTLDGVDPHLGDGLRYARETLPRACSFHHHRLEALRGARGVARHGGVAARGGVGLL